MLDGVNENVVIPVSDTAPEPLNSHVPVSSPNEAPVAPFADNAAAELIVNPLEPSPLMRAFSFANCKGIVPETCSEAPEPFVPQI